MAQLSATAPWLDHLTPADRDVLDRACGPAGCDPARWRRDDAELGRLLAHPATYDAVAKVGGDEPIALVSPFLVFATAVHRGWAELQDARHVDEWVGARQRLPVLGGDDLRAFLAAAPRRLFLASLLASYTSVASGSTWVRTARGWRRTRFSELDPVRLAALLDVVPPDARAGVYRRLGDLALFLTGVFPDHTERYAFGLVGEERLLRTTPLEQEPSDVELAFARGPVGMLERLGEQWYRFAARAAAPLTGTMRVVAEVAEQFGAARRVLNVVTDRYLFPFRSRLFDEPSG